MIEKAFFIISDITGYTMYLTQSELDHAQEILQALFDGQLSLAKPPVYVSNFQGDAIFMYVPENAVAQRQTLIEIVEKIYFSFVRQLEYMRSQNTCTCRACSNMSNLDLKLFVHHGQCIVQKLGGREELIGPDVIVVHRMMKNSVYERTGIRAYALFTEAAAEALNLRGYCMELVGHTETYEHVGEVRMLVHSLEEAWKQEKEKRRTRVMQEEAWIRLETEVAAPPALVWDYLTREDLKRRWAGLDVEERTDDLGGRVREGSTYHCAHGDMHIYYTVIDWNPFEHLTVRQAFPGLPELVLSDLLFPLPDGRTRVLFLCGRPDVPLPGEVRQELLAMFDEGIARLREVVEEDVGAGKVSIA